ncbi:helix-turn-helix domain-containing protein [Chitinibacter sp. ZOR0017]|uniref:helix-turn-helix domain-containing protein n=1 Tax=Chitinibacter sp. ZOR0017 TaxID=1339254 RepID=UPI0006463D93|nr:helix-turn-helix domain-containing protein [Chitinibacter sp. ZOR0017]
MSTSVLFLNKGDTFVHGDREYVIVALADLTHVLAKAVGTQEKVLIDISTILPPKSVNEAPITGALPVAVDLSEVSDEEWQEAERKKNLLEPLLNPYESAKDAVDRIVKESGVSRPTLYRWLAAYRETGLLSSLLPTKRSGGRGKGRLPIEIEAIIRERIENYHLTEQQPSVAKTAKEVQRLCRNADLLAPHLTSIRRRIEWITQQERLSRRKGARAASLQFDPNLGSIPDAEWPLALVQMDHTLLPVMIVSDISRKSIKRPWITLMIDVYSRMILGMYLTLDPPSAMSAGMCVSHAILPKEKWLHDLGVDVSWPCWGVMGCLHMDNAREFRGEMLRVACHEYDIDLNLRPVKKPEYGAHIERLMGTVSENLKHLPGATFSGIDEKGDYDAENKATMTLSELEKWLILMIAHYHNSLHTGIGCTPLQKWKEGLLGGNGQLPRGLPARRLDEEKIRLDFLPFEERSVQDYGVVLDDIYYFHDVLRPWINSRDPKYHRHARLFRFRRDPRDISQLYFFDPNSQHYYAIPYRNTSLPAASIWELRDAKSQLRKEGKKNIDERMLFDLINRQRQLEDESAEKTKVARRAQQKRIEHDKSRKNLAKRLPTVAKATPSAMPPKIEGYDPSAIRSFDEE